MFFIQSQRLRLLPLAHSQLQLLAQNRNQMEVSLGLNPSNMQISPLYRVELEDALQNFWLPKTAQYAGQYYWYTNWEMILLSKNKSIGGIGICKPNKRGEAIIGYYVDEAYHRQGFATEAALRMAEWYFEQPGAKTLLATTSPDNVASFKTLEKCGFRYQKTKDGLLYYHYKK